jgi:citrate synthase
MDNLVVDTTEVSLVDGQAGSLSYRGIDVLQLSRFSNFEESAFLLLFGKLPNKAELERFVWKLRHLTVIPERTIRIIQELPSFTPPLYAMQCCLATLGAMDMAEELDVNENLVEKAMRIIALSSLIIATVYRHLKGLPLLLPRNDLTHTQNFLYMLQGYVPNVTQTSVLEQALILQMDHGFNASTFVARAVASTLTNLYSAVSAAVGALAGPLHGGASPLVVQMLEEARHYGDAAGYTLKLLASGKRIQGMGHRVYRTTDPRAHAFESLLQQLTPVADAQSELVWLRQIEYTARSYFKRSSKPIFTNVDFWSGAVYKCIGINPVLYPSLFAISRVVGWLAHILELRQNNRLYRPKSKYVGAVQVKYIPMEDRGREKA